jgi:hypothetical protein
VGEHDIEADWASAEVARLLEQKTAHCLTSPVPPPAGLHTFAGRELATNKWPRADGVVSFKGTATPEYAVAVEYKRAQEGIHGILTAIGQALAYIAKGYSAAAIVVPSAYLTHAAPGAFLDGVLTATAAAAPVGVFTYEDADPSLPSPYVDRIGCVRKFAMGAPPPAGSAPTRRTETQWGHLREGSTTRAAVFRLLQTMKRFPFESPPPLDPLPPELVAAVGRVRPGADPLRYLSSTADDTDKSRIWRQFWFRWLATRDVLQPWDFDGTTYAVPSSLTLLELDDGTGMQRWFAGRKDSIKNVVVHGLNSGALTEDGARDLFVKNLAERAHSIREDLDSGLAHFGLLGPDDRPTDLGYRYVDLCERAGADSEAAKELFAEILLQEGRLGAFLHYVYRLSSEAFASDPLRWATPPARPGLVWRFDDRAYLEHIESEMANRLKVLRKVSPRGGTARSPFQAELALLRRYGFVRRKSRVGIGMDIDWVRVQEASAVAL